MNKLFEYPGYSQTVFNLIILPGSPEKLNKHPGKLMVTGMLLFSLFYGSLFDTTPV